MGKAEELRKRREEQASKEQQTALSAKPSKELSSQGAIKQTAQLQKHHHLAPKSVIPEPPASEKVKKPKKSYYKPVEVDKRQNNPGRPTENPGKIKPTTLYLKENERKKVFSYWRGPKEMANWAIEQWEKQKGL